MSDVFDYSPFLNASNGQINTNPVQDAAEPIVYESASDGLAVFNNPQRSMLSWFRGYTRAGCRCGQCPLGQEEPCEYALPESPSLISKTCSAVYGRASGVVHMTHGGLTKMLSMGHPMQRIPPTVKHSAE